MSEELGLFNGKDTPDLISGWELFEKGKEYATQIKLEETVNANENFFIGKQWEGVQANGLPTPVYNFIKRVVSFICATITSDNVKCTASALAATLQTSQLLEPVRYLNEEFEALTERNKIPSLILKYARNAAVDGDGCTYTYWDPDERTGQRLPYSDEEIKGAIKTELVENTRVYFGNPQDRDVQSQEWIIIWRRIPVRKAKLKAKANGCTGWKNIVADEDERTEQDAAKHTDGLVTEVLLMWKDEDGVVNGYEFTRKCETRQPWSLDIKMYPITWTNWDYVQDSFHGQAMITGLIPNQIFVNKLWAMTQVSAMRMAFPKVIFDKTRIKQWDNRVGGAIGITGGDTNAVARIIEPAAISPQVSELIKLSIEESEQTLGATAVALGDTRPDNTSAIIALQRAAATPSEITKKNINESVEELYRIYAEFIGAYYGTRMVDREPTAQEKAAIEMTGQEVPEEIPVPFDFSIIALHPMLMKLEVGASSYYSEIASIHTLDNLLTQGKITTSQYLQRIPDSYIPARRSLLLEVMEQDAMQQQMQMMQMGMMPPQGPAPGGEAPPEEGGTDAQLQEKMEIPVGKGYNRLTRAVNQGADVR